MNLILYLKKFWIIYGILFGYLLALVLNSVGFNVWLPVCPIKAVTGIECMGCGMNHAFIDLLSGNFSAAYSHNPLLFIFLPLILLSIIYHYSKFLKPNKTVKNHD